MHGLSGRTKHAAAHGKPARNFDIPAESIRNGWLESSFGLHLVSVNLFFEGIIVAAAAIAAIVLFTHTLLSPGLGISKYCCYPEDIEDGVLGECTDPLAVIHKTPGVTTCPTRSVEWVRRLFISLYLAVGTRMLVYLFDLPFERRVNKLLHALQATPDAIPYLQWFVAMYSPGAILFGTHNRILGRHTVRSIHRFLGVLSVIFLTLFFTVALQLDAAWKCYGNVGASETDRGECNNPTSIAHRTLPHDATTHTPVFWGLLICTCSATFSFFVIYFVSLTNLRIVFTRRVARYYSVTLAFTHSSPLGGKTL